MNKKIILFFLFFLAIDVRAQELKIVTGTIDHLSCHVSDEIVLKQARDHALNQANDTCFQLGEHFASQISDWDEHLYIRHLDFGEICRWKGAWARASFRCIPSDNSTKPIDSNLTTIAAGWGSTIDEDSGNSLTVAQAIQMAKTNADQEAQFLCHSRARRLSDYRVTKWPQAGFLSFKTEATYQCESASYSQGK